MVEDTWSVWLNCGSRLVTVLFQDFRIGVPVLISLQYQRFDSQILPSVQPAITASNSSVALRIQHWPYRYHFTLLSILDQCLVLCQHPYVSAIFPAGPYTLQTLKFAVGGCLKPGTYFGSQGRTTAHPGF